MVERFRPSASFPAPAPGKKKPPGQKPVEEPKKALKESSFLVRPEITFLHSGCTLLDCVIGGGWPFSRMVNIVGDKSTGKTLIAEEAMINFIRRYKEKPHYRETESAFDLSYFEALGGNSSMVDFGPDGPDTHWQTIEQIIDDMRALLDKRDAKVLAKAKALKERKEGKKRTLASLQEQVRKTLPPGLYIVDSLDSLSSGAEIKRTKKDREDQTGSYNLEKQKLFGEFMRTEIGRIKRANICFMIISQTRDRIGTMIRGKQYRRHCDKVLDFYCSAVIYLADLGKAYEQVRGIKRAVAIKVKAKADKNKIVAPFRECEFELRFGYGMDNDWACLDFLKAVKRLNVVGLTDLPKNLNDVDTDNLRKKTIEVWNEIEKAFLPPKGKYAA